jgi:hypothetical protein
MYQFLNYFFIVFHTVWILFNSLAWIPKKTRRLNLISLCITAFSWFVLGIWYGWGYCVCTDLHWKVRAHLGYRDMEMSYTHFLARKLTGIDFNPNTVDVVTAAVFFISFALSITLNIIDLRRKKL